MKKLLTSLPRQLVLPLFVFGGILAGLGAYAAYMARIHTYLGDDPSVCINCHIMAPYYNSWDHSSHGRRATCNDCHVPHDNVFLNTGMISYVDAVNGKGKACWDCHTSVPHGKRSNLNGTPDAVVPLPKSPVPDWLKKMMGSGKSKI